MSTPHNPATPAQRVKQCATCERTKPASEFPKRRRVCKTCVAIEHRARMAHCLACFGNKRASEASRYQRPEVRARRMITESSWDQAHPNAKAARAAVARARKRGDLQPVKTVCSVCGQFRRCDAHHAKGYAPEHWLDVVIACRSCHRSEHGHSPRSVDGSFPSEIPEISAPTKGVAPTIKATGEISIFSAAAQALGRIVRREQRGPRP